MSDYSTRMFWERDHWSVALRHRGAEVASMTMLEWTCLGATQQAIEDLISDLGLQEAAAAAAGAAGTPGPATPA